MLQKDDVTVVSDMIDLGTSDIDMIQAQQISSEPKSSDEHIDIPISTAEDESTPETDDGTHLLYPDIELYSPFKTSDRLLDDIISDVTFMNLEDLDINGILREPVLKYSRMRHNIQPHSIGSVVDQIVLQTKYDYESLTCPQYNKIKVWMGVLIDPTQKPYSFDDISQLKINHLKVTVKTRSYLERNNKHVGISRYHLVQELHQFDKDDLLTFDPNDQQLLDHAVYVSNDTNKLILIEIFKPEFDSQEERDTLSIDTIESRYNKACVNFESLNPSNIPTQIDCINTMFKIFKGPLTRKSDSEPLKTISSENFLLNSRMNAGWLTSKYGFELHVEKDNETTQEAPQFQPPILVDYIKNPVVRRQREAITRKCLELTFLGKMSIGLMSPELLKVSSKSIRTFKLLQTNFTTSFWSQILEEHRNTLEFDNYTQFNLDYHFIALSVSYHYTERDIIQNFELQSKLDPQNNGVYYDALTFIANTKGAYQLISYCGKLDIVGQEALDLALDTFKLDPASTDLSTLSDSFILSIYKSEIHLATLSSNRKVVLRNALRILAKVQKSLKLQFYVDYELYRQVSQAYNILEVDESVDDDIVQTAYTIKINDSPGLKIDCDRALYTIATFKRSISLFKFLLQECPPFENFYGPGQFTYQGALQLFQINENVGDDTILEIFQRRWFHETILEADQLLNLKSALTKIAFERNSMLISHYLETGVIASSFLPAENWPIGLNNIGNTCYLNSLLQYYFSIAPLRNYVSLYQQTVDDIQGDLEKKINRRIGGREINDIEVERSVQFVYQLRDLFNEMVYSSSRCVTPRKELAYLAFAPSNIEVEFEASNENMNESENDLENHEKSESFLEPKLIDIDSDKKIEYDGEGNSVLQVNDAVFKPDPKNMSTSTKVAKIGFDQLENALEMGRQQDVTECIGNVLFQLESASEPSSLEDDNEQYDLIKELFYGKTMQSIIPLNAGTQVRTKIERFLSLLVNIGDRPKDVYDALDSYFRDEYLKMEEYGDVKKSLVVTAFPTILQIQIQRVYYDREKCMPFKSIQPLPFSDMLYMDRYAETDNQELIKTKEEMTKLKEELKCMKKRQQELLSRNELGLSRKEALLETKKLLTSDVLESQGIHTENKELLIEQLNNALKSVDTELSQLYNSIIALESKIGYQFDKFQDIGYSLFAVFIHRGEASYGHYWVYIKDFEKDGIWRKYNDETVTEVPQLEVFNFTESNTATPYFLVYVRDTHQNDIEPLKRIVSQSA